MTNRDGNPPLKSCYRLFAWFNLMPPSVEGTGVLLAFGYDILFRHCIALHRR